MTNAEEQFKRAESFVNQTIRYHNGRSADDVRKLLAITEKRVEIATAINANTEPETWLMEGALDLRNKFTFAADAEETLVREQAFSVKVDSSTVEIQIHVPAIPGYLRNFNWHYNQISDALYDVNLTTRRKMAFDNDITTRSFTLSQRFSKYGEPLGRLNIHRSVVQSNLNMTQERFDLLDIYDDLTADEKELQALLTKFRPYILAIYQWMVRDAVQVWVNQISIKLT